MKVKGWKRPHITSQCTMSSCGRAENAQEQSLGHASCDIFIRLCSKGLRDIEGASFQKREVMDQVCSVSFLDCTLAQNLRHCLGSFGYSTVWEFLAVYSMKLSPRVSHVEPQARKGTFHTTSAATWYQKCKVRIQTIHKKVQYSLATDRTVGLVSALKYGISQTARIVRAAPPHWSAGSFSGIP